MKDVGVRDWLMFVNINIYLTMREIEGKFLFQKFVRKVVRLAKRKLDYTRCDEDEDDEDDYNDDVDNDDDDDDMMLIKIMTMMMRVFHDDIGKQLMMTVTMIVVEVFLVIVQIMLFMVVVIIMVMMIMIMRIQRNYCYL